jgi:hypothetical protein
MPTTSGAYTPALPGCRLQRLRFVMVLPCTKELAAYIFRFACFCV